MTVSVAEGPIIDPLALRRKAILFALALALVIATVLALSTGAMQIPPSHVIAILLSKLGLDLGVPLGPYETAALLDIRLPRIALGIGVGAMLGSGGAALQALFRNPLADPGLVGVSGGAACGAVGWIVLGAAAPTWMHGTSALPVAAFIGGLITTASVQLTARAQGRTEVATLLLAGLAINALTAAVLGYLTYLGTDAQLRSLTFWMLGGLGGAVGAQIWPALILMALPMMVLGANARAFDLLALGESSAGHLGLSVGNIRRLTILCVALSVGAGVALTGVIGFIGLVAPHLVRLLGGPAHRYVLPGAALCGALLLTLADLVARTLVIPAELPIGIVTSALGAPFFIWLLRSRIAGGRA